jgi:hypothetical protein
VPYVMVPVPEEHVEAVMQFILRAVAQASLEEWDAESLEKLWGDLDEVARSLLSYTARAASAGNELDIADAAQQMQVNQREVMAIVNELANLARSASRSQLISWRAITDRLPNGRTIDKRVLVMTPELADIVSAIDRADLLDAMPPGAE